MRIAPPAAETGLFLEDVRAGLTARPKSLPCRWLYDAEGSRLFEAIMGLPEYYPTRCEARILEVHKEGMLRALGDPPRAFHVVDLGAGNGAKTRVLLAHIRAMGRLRSYVPVDVSPQALEALADSLGRELPGLPVRPLEGDWLEALEGFGDRFPGPKLTLFLGSNIGNQDRPGAEAFLTALRARLAPGDALLIGFDLRKDPARILRAYSDSAGVTARFNLNLLDRINRELGGAFRREDFRHRATYDPREGVARSYLVARRSHAVPIEAAGLTVAFRAGEAIHTESSHKYSAAEIESMARASGFSVAAHFRDPTESFLDSLWLPDGPPDGLPDGLPERLPEQPPEARLPEAGV